MKEALIAYALCFALTCVCAGLASVGGMASEISWFVATGSLFLLPILLVRRIHPRDEREAGIALEWSARDFLTGLAVLAAIFVPVMLGNHFVRTAIQHLEFHFSWHNYAQLPHSLAYEILIQLFAVALPEEFFYRGYLQTAFLQHFRAKPALASRAPVLAILLASACFAAVHFPSGGFVRLLTFFPGLLFGTLRHKTGGLIACILCHAGCNLMMTVMNVHYFPD